MKHSIFMRILIGLTVCALLPAANGCGKNTKRDIILYGSEDDSNKDKTYLTFYGFKADAINLTAIEAALHSFMTEHSNISITYEGIKGTEYWNVFDKRIEAGSLDDVFMVHHDSLIALSSQGKLADLSDLPGLENYTDEVKGQFTNADGSVYFLPTQLSTYNLYINYDILKEHGQSVPENWDDFQKCCDYFVSRGIVPIIGNNRNSLPTLIVSRGLFNLYQKQDAGGTIKKFNEDPSLLADELLPGIEQTEEMLKRGWFDRDEVMTTEQTSDDLDIFLKGDRPFMISGGWASTRVMSKNPDFTYGVHPYPILKDGSVLSIQADTCISVNADSSALNEAKEFVDHLISPDVMWAYCDSQASYTPLKEEKRLPSEKTLIPSTEYLSNGRVVFRNDYRLDLPVEAALISCADTLLNGGTAEEAKTALSEALR